MNMYRKAAVVAGCFGVMLGAVGCANKDIVKKDEPIVAVKPVASLPATPAVQKTDETKNTAPAVQVVPASTADQSAKQTVIEAAFDKIYFDFDSSDLSKSARDTLSRSAEVLMQNKKNVKLRIEGNCDERGSAEYNLALGELRAKSAAKYLTALGVQPERLEVISYGKEKPAVQGSDEAAWSKNRRDEFVIQR